MKTRIAGFIILLLFLIETEVELVASKLLRVELFGIT